MSFPLLLMLLELVSWLVRQQFALFQFKSKFLDSGLVCWWQNLLLYHYRLMLYLLWRYRFLFIALSTLFCDLTCVRQSRANVLGQFSQLYLSVWVSIQFKCLFDSDRSEDCQECNFVLFGSLGETTILRLGQEWFLELNWFELAIQCCILVL